MTRCLLALSILLSASCFAENTAFDPVRFDQHIAELCKGPHRLSGTRECTAAHDYIAGELKSIGYTVEHQHFTVPRCEYTECKMTVDGKEVELLPMRANLLQAAATGPDGITGNVIYAGLGATRDFDGLDPRGAIVLIDYSQFDGGSQAFALGAAAVVYVEDEHMNSYFAADKLVNITADLPRYFMRRDVASKAGLLNHGTIQATISCAAHWVVNEGDNLIAILPGTTPVNAEDEALILSCNYDTLGTVATLAPGARAAANVAALLETARLLKNAPPPARTIVFAFFDDECQYHTGSRHFYYALHAVRPENLKDDLLQTVRAGFYSDEKKYIDEILTSLERIPEGESFDLSFLSDAAVRELDHTATWEADRFIPSISRLNKLSAKKKSDNEPFVEIDERVIKLRKEKSAWSELRAELKDRSLKATAFESYAQTRQITLKRLNKRRSELAELEARNAEYIHLGELLKLPNQKPDADPKFIRIVGHFAFDFSDDMPQWGLVVGGYCPLDTDKFVSSAGTYSKAFGAIRGEVSKLRDRKVWKSDHFFDSTINGLYGPFMFVPSLLTHAGEVAEAFGYFGFCFATVGDGCLRDGLPSDSQANLKSAVILDQAHEAAELLQMLASDPEFGLRSNLSVKVKHLMYTRKDGTLRGNNVIYTSEGTSIADEPAAGAIIASLPAKNNAMAFSQDSFIPGFDHAIYGVIDANGYFDLPSVVPSDWAFDAATFDKRGRVKDIVSHGVDDGRKTFYNPTNPIKLKLFLGQGATLSLCRDTLTGGMFKDGDWKLLDALTDGDFMNGYYIRQVDSTLSFYVPVGKSAKLFGKTVLPILGSTAENPLGTGISWTPEDPNADPAFPGVQKRLCLTTAPTASHDLWTLNESRLALLRHAGLFNNSLERMHGFGEDQLSASKDSIAGNKWGSGYAHAEAATVAGNRIYGPIIGMMNDVVQAVIFLLGLTIPFAFSLERLLIGSPNIYRQIAGFGFFFLLTFLALYFVHPAFQLAATPLIIFLAFAIIVMSGFVIVIVMQKFQHEIRSIQGMAGTVHSAEVSRVSTTLAAVEMGISTMRRRPLRTTLTAITVVLLTFTILCFASFASASGVIETYIGQQNNHSYILVHNVTWSPMSQSQIRAMKALLADEADVFARPSMSGMMSAMQAPIMKPNSRTPMVLNGIVGISESERKVTPEVFDALEGDVQRMLDGDGIFLSQDMLEKLQAKKGDTVAFLGFKFTVAGTFDDAKLEKIRQLDGAPFLPLDFQAAMEMSQSQNQSQPEDVLRSILENLDPGSLTSISPSQTAFISGKGLEALGSGARALLIVPKKPEAAEAIAKKVAMLSDNYVFCGMPDGVHKFHYTDRLNFTGVGDLIVPLALGGLIVFSTMLGSVVEREKEIFTFSALGLAPPHVALLFFAEVCIYAVLGGLGGYLLGQTFVSVLTFLSTHYGIVRVPDVNYSSTTAIITILIVMTTVLISTVYPAIKASRSANPGVNRSWKIPKPQGDIHQIAFPFTVSVYDMKGIVSFLKEYLDSHNDISLGHFSAQGAEIVKIGESRMLGLTAKVWLAPFDLGVSQTFTLATAASEIPGIQEVNIRFDRLSGRPANWERFNRIFINDLRKQFLIWRALNHDAMENYRTKTDEALATQASARQSAVSPAVVGETQSV